MRLASMAEMLASLSITCSFCQRTVGRGMKLYEIVNVFEGDVNLVIGEMKNRLQQHIGCTCSGYAKGSLSSADITDACLATLNHYWGKTGEITPEHALECINNEKEKAETQPQQMCILSSRRCLTLPSLHMACWALRGRWALAL
jgi:hypothetical protein